jgi:VCBS repeat-containing protein
MMYDGAGAVTVATVSHHHHHGGADNGPNPGADTHLPVTTHTGGESPSTAQPSKTLDQAPNVPIPPWSGPAQDHDKHSHTDTVSEPMPHVVTWVKDPTEIVFIDAQVPDAAILAQGAKPGVEVVMLDAHSDGVQQIANFLSRHPDPNLTTIDIVAHGADGVVQLGTTLLSSSTMGYYQSQLAAIGHAMQPGGTIQIFGCDVAQDINGDLFLVQLSQATGGKNVDGASHLVGATSLGGSWTLDVEVSGGNGGTRAAANPFTDATLAGYSDVLPDEIFVTSNNPVGVTADSTGTVNNTATLTATGTLIQPTYIAVDPAHGVFYVVDNENGLSSGAEQAIYVGAISGTLADGHQVDKIFSVPATDFDRFGGIALDPVSNTLYFAQSASSEYNAGGPNATLDQINGIFSLNLNGLNLSNPGGPGTLSETLVAYGPNLGVLQGDIALDPINHKLYFIDDSAGKDSGNTGGIDPNTSATNNIYVATIGSSPSQASSILQLAASDTLNGLLEPTGYAQGFLSGLALDPTNQTLYFSTWDLNDSATLGTNIDNVYKVAIPAPVNQIIILPAPLFTAAGVGDPYAVEVDVSAGQLYVLDRNANGNEAGAIDQGAVSGATPTRIFAPATGRPPPLLEGFALDAAAVLTTSGSITTYNEGSTPDQIDSGLSVTTLSDPGENLVGATVSIGTGFDAGHDQLNFAASGITSSYNATTGMLTLSGVASAATYAAALQSVTFSTDSSSAAQRTISFTVTDGVVTSNTGTDHVNVNVAPRIGGTAVTTDFYQSTGAPEVLDSGITVTDPSGANITHATVTIGGAISGDTLTISGQTTGSIGAINFSFAGTTLTLTGSDTAANYAAALEQVRYSFAGGGDPTGAGTDTTRAITWSVTDANNHTSAAGTSTTLDVFATPLVVVGSNSPTPTVTTSSGAVLADPGLSITDFNANPFTDAASSATVQITGGFHAGDLLTIGSLASGTVPTTNISFSYSGSTLTLSGAASLADYMTALDEVQFNASSPNSGTRTLSWQVNDEAGANVNDSGPVTSTVNVAFGPVVVAESAALLEGTTASGTAGIAGSGALHGDSDPGGGSLSISAVVGGTVGTSVAGTYGHLTLNADGSYSYVADQTTAIDAATTGSKPVDTFQYTVTDSAGQSTLATIAFTIDRPPVVVAESASLVEGTTASGTAGIAGSGALHGDSDPDKDALSVTAVIGGAVGGSTAGTYGHLTLNADGSYSYVADNTAAINAAAAGSKPVDTFSYTVSDGQGGTTTAHLSFTIDRPPVVVAESESVVEGATASGTAGTAGSGALHGDSDPDNDALSVTAVAGGAVGGSTAGTYGHLTLNADGSYSYVADNTAAINAAAAGAKPVDTFSYTVSDGQGSTTTAQLSFTIDRPPVVVAQTNNAIDTAAQDAGTVVASATTVATGVLHGDSDPDSGDELTVSAVNGSAANVGSGVAGTFGTLNLAADGRYTYTANAAFDALTAGQHVADQFTITVSDGHGGTADTTLTITITGADDAPVVTAPTATSFNANDGRPGLIGTGIAVRDVDSANLSEATVAIAAGFNAGDVLAANTSGTSIHASYDAVHGVLTLSGNDTVGDYQKVLASVTINSTQSQNGTATISWQVSDQSNLAGAAVTSEVSITGAVVPQQRNFTDNHASDPVPDVTLVSLTSNGDRGFQPPSTDGDSAGGGVTGPGFFVVHTDPVLTTAADATVNIHLPLDVLEAELGGDVVSVTARLANGDPLPGWLKFDPATGTLAGLPPDNAVASIEPDRSADTDVITGTLPPKPDPGSDAAARPTTITIDVTARDSQGHIAVTVFTIDLRPRTAGKQGWNIDRTTRPAGQAHLASQPLLSPELAAIEAAVRDVTRPIEPFAIRGAPAGHSEWISGDATEAVPAGRAGLTEQLASLGWRSMAAQRNALLASLQRR